MINFLGGYVKLVGAIALVNPSVDEKNINTKKADKLLAQKPSF